MVTEQPAQNATAGGNAVQGLPEWIQEPLNAFIAALPEIIGALAILVIGWIVGAFLGGLVRRLAGNFDLDRRTRDTPLGRMFGDSRDPVAKFLGKLTKWFIIALAALAAANMLAIPELSQWISQAVSYIPALIGGLLIIIVGFIVADFIGDMVQRTGAATQYRYTSIFASAIRFFLYFTVIVIGLETMGVNVGILYIFGRALAWGLALGIGAAIALAFGWGSKDYVRENIGDWTSKAQDRMRRQDEG